MSTLTATVVMSYVYGTDAYNYFKGMSSEILPAETAEKSAAPLAQPDDDIDDTNKGEAVAENDTAAPLAQPDDDVVDTNNGEVVAEDDVDAAPTRRSTARQQEGNVVPLAEAEEDVADKAVDPHIRQARREMARLALIQDKKNPQTAININNNNIPAPNRPQTSYALSKYVYNMHHKQRGKAIIINNVNFHRATGMSKRGGSHGDADGLHQVFQKLGFAVHDYTDLTVKKLRAVLNSVSKQDHSDADCLVFAIMSHGDEGVLYCTDDTIPVEEVTKPFRGDKCPSLAGKPKLFFIQACRGQQLDSGVEIARDEADAVYGIPGEDRQIIPSEADFLVGYSSPPGYYSWRNQGDGAWFIRGVVSVLRQHGTELEIQQMMTRVNHIVAYEYMSNCSIPGYDQKKQVPCIVSTLTKDLYFSSTANDGQTAV